MRLFLVFFSSATLLLLAVVAFYLFRSEPLGDQVIAAEVANPAQIAGPLPTQSPASVSPPSAPVSAGPSGTSNLQIPSSESEWEALFERLVTGKGSRAKRAQSLMRLAGNPEVPEEYQSMALEYAMYFLEDAQLAAEVVRFMESGLATEEQMGNIFGALVDRDERTHLKTLLAVAQVSGEPGKLAKDRMTALVQPDENPGSDWNRWDEVIDETLAESEFREATEQPLPRPTFLKYRGLQNIDD